MSRSGSVNVAAVDLGASGGRVIAARVADGGIKLHEVSRFPNEPVLAGGTLHWDIARLHASVVAGLLAAAATVPLASAGIDSWGCDYGLLDASGALLGNPVHYRDARTDGVAPPVPFPELYAATGIQHLPFNTIYQLAAARGTPALSAARTLLLIPDLLGYWLTGSAGAEVTNASTTALLDVTTRTWATSVMRRVGIDPGLFPPLRQPGDMIGPITQAGPASGLRDRPAGDQSAAGGLRDGSDSEQAECPIEPLGARSLSGVPLIAVGSHDTASAVVAVPASGPDFAFISSGTWSLVGMELTAPVLTAASREANFTNEAGIDGTVRYLRNVTGLWLLQECLRHWGTGDRGTGDLGPLLARAAAEPRLRFVIDADDPAFLPPGDMPGRIAAWLSSRGLPVPSGPVQVIRCVLDSLALAYRRAVLDVQALSGRHADVVHIVGGGSRNELLCQLTADATGLPVVAGPAEGTALGNAAVQARALGAAPGDLGGLRAMVRAVAAVREYAPSGDGRAWEPAARRISRAATPP